MNYFDYCSGHLFAEDVDLRRIVDDVGTPCYVYSRATLERHWRAFDSVFAEHAHLICYAVKANSNLAVLNVLARLGSGFDIVSGGELRRVIAAGGEPSKVVFSGVGKSADEIRYALELGIRCFNVESRAELKRLNDIAGEVGVCAPVSIRVNPDVDAKTHPYISTGLKENKFGIDIEYTEAVYQHAAELSHIDVQGIDCHIGSQLNDISPFVDALDRVLLLIDNLAAQGIKLRHIDMGGGLGITYRDEMPPSPADYAAAILTPLKERGLEIVLEPGRAIAGNAGILLTQVEYIKPGEAKSFAIVDAAMNDLLRPALYGAWQDIIPLEPRDNDSHADVYDVVGPICETGDFLGKERQLTIEAGDVLAVCSAGAYGFGMSSNYNSRPRVAEVMVDGDQYTVVRKRETLENLWQGETTLPD
ncbi:MAG: diaminopimelate decarboxylase [Gammaproteobacteria bacterium]|nr:diaminopimelate decarboxylase [Gammaproteobacteria bacterium]MCF6260951.1 diaminopimelate decarboxylase [Gammaproteobacteria bacterium]